MKKLFVQSPVEVVAEVEEFGVIQASASSPVAPTPPTDVAHALTASVGLNSDMNES